MSLLDSLPAVIQRPELKQDDVQSVNGGDERQHIIVHSRDLTQEEIDLFRGYGTTLIWTPAYQNIPIAKLKFNYLLVDIRQKEARVLMMVNHTEPYHVIGVCSRWETLDDWSGQLAVENLLKSLPAKSPFKGDWDALLSCQKVNAPSCTKAVIRLLLDIVSGISKK
jgi:hypothetical protein